MNSLVFFSKVIWALPLHPMIPNDEPLGIVTQDHWILQTEDRLQFRAVDVEWEALLPTEDGQFLGLYNGQAFVVSDFGCEDVPIDIAGVVHALAPTPEGYAGFMLAEIEGTENNWLLHQNLGAAQSWPAIRQFSAIEADLQSTEHGWAILKNTTVGWTLEYSLSTGGTPTPHAISLTGTLSLLDATDTEALIQRRALSTSIEHGADVTLYSELYYWHVDSGLTRLDQKTDGTYWVQGILGHSHGIYVLTDQGLVQNHLNGFIVEGDEAPCIWKNKNSELLWICSSLEDDVEYYFWQTADGIQWTSRLSVADQSLYECSDAEGEDTSTTDPPAKACQSYSTSFKGLGLFWLITLALTTRQNRDSGAILSYKP